MLGGAILGCLEAQYLGAWRRKVCVVGGVKVGCCEAQYLGAWRYNTWCLEAQYLGA